MKKTYLIGNWKANKTQSQAQSWISQVSQSLPKIPPSLEIVICPSFIHLHLFKSLPAHKLGAQDLSPFGNGAYTGAISADMLAGVVDYVIVGHSERHFYFKETDQDIVLKVSKAIDNDITPIIAVHSKNYLTKLNKISKSELEKSLILYEPPEAISRQIGPIGKGSAAPVNQVVKIITKIKAAFPNNSVLYGGSIKSNNLSQFLANKIIDGVLPGSASLDSSQWLELISTSIKARG